MSRHNKQLRRQHRKEKRVDHSSPHRSGLAGAQVVHLLSYGITAEPLPDTQHDDPAIEAVIGDGKEIFDLCHDNPSAAISRLETLLRRFPGSRLLLNWLSRAYLNNGDNEQAEEIVELNYRQNPDYLFARANYAEICSRRGQWDEVERIFDGKFDLKLLYPRRNVFHISEFLALGHIAVRFHIHNGDFEVAENLYKTMRDIAPHHEVTRATKKLVQGSQLLACAEAHAKRLKAGSRRVPSRVEPVKK